MKALITCVNYADYLELTLPRNLRHFSDILVVTTPKDAATWEVVRHMPHVVNVHMTEAFYWDGAPFNKGAAIEEGFDVLGREGWLCVLDADVILPPRPALFADFQPGLLYSPYRRCLEDPGKLTDDLDWDTLPWGWEHPDCPRQAKVRNDEYAGYCQMFHAGDSVLAKWPWYTSDWPTARGCDTNFYQRWPAEKRRRPDWTVLHLGPLGQNWEGKK